MVKYRIHRFKFLLAKSTDKSPGIATALSLLTDFRFTTFSLLHHRYDEISRPLIRLVIYKADGWNVNIRNSRLQIAIGFLSPSIQFI
jgi:hypothetical protein